MVENEPSMHRWSIWKKGNGSCFENKSNSIQIVEEKCIVSLYLWCKKEFIEEVEQLVDLLGSQ